LLLWGAAAAAAVAGPGVASVTYRAVAPFWQQPTSVACIIILLLLLLLLLELPLLQLLHLSSQPWLAAVAKNPEPF